MSFDMDVAIIGAGPAGIAAATSLARAGVREVTVFERETSPGGIPRHTHHPTFGLRVFRRPMKGPAFVARILARVPGLRIETGATLTALHPEGRFEIAMPDGLHQLRARHIILATGARETPRHPRLVPGLRPQGIITTGALQQFIYGAGMVPFRRPAIVGSELVSFSALWTLRHAGLRPVAMIEPGARITAYRPAILLARALAVPVRLNTRIADIDAAERLETITLETPEGRARLAVDGLIFTGRFVGENTIAGASHLGLAPGTRIPLVDQNRLTTDPRISAVGNAVHPADMGDQCYQEGLAAGAHVARLLRGAAEAGGRILPIETGENIRFTTPSILRPEAKGPTRFDLWLHVKHACRGRLSLEADGRKLGSWRRRCMPARRITLGPVTLPADLGETAALRLLHDPAG